MWQMMHDGGPMMWVIAAVSFLGAGVFLERLFHLRRAQIHPGDFLEGIFNVLKGGNVAEGVSICDATAGPVARIVRAALLQHDEDAEAMRRAVEEAGLSEIPRLEHRVGVLATVAQVAPILGLLGTVLGMIQALLQLERQAPLVQAGDLAGGLWQALLTTAAGLAVAVPAYVGYNLLIARVESVLLDMERASGEIVGFLLRQRERGKEVQP